MAEEPAGAAGWEPPPCAGEVGGVEAPIALEPDPPASEAPPGPPEPPLALLLPLEPPGPPPARGHCLLGNWQEERATQELDRVPSPEDGSEGFYFRHGHRGLLTLQRLAGLASSTTTKDSYRSPGRWPTALPPRGQREAMMEWLLYQKYSKQAFEEDVDPPPGTMESLSTTHRDYRQDSFFSMPPAPTKTHDYRTEQPQTFWLEHARRVPGVSQIRTGDTPFRKNASFTTPAAESLDDPVPCSPENHPLP
uniref:Uncharacterized protein n=1 Tax=Sphaerodactylus townsendi TaxID=933632 RepID=A0ACB8ENZ8_9SAUR